MALVPIQSGSPIPQATPAQSKTTPSSASALVISPASGRAFRTSCATPPPPSNPALPTCHFETLNALRAMTSSPRLLNANSALHYNPSKHLGKRLGAFLPLRVGGVGGADGERAGVRCSFHHIWVHGGGLSLTNHLPVFSLRGNFPPSPPTSPPPPLTAGVELQHRRSA